MSILESSSDKDKVLTASSSFKLQQAAARRNCPHIHSASSSFSSLSSKLAGSWTLTSVVSPIFIPVYSCLLVLLFVMANWNTKTSTEASKQQPADPARYRSVEVVVVQIKNKDTNDNRQRCHHHHHCEVDPYMRTGAS